MGKQNQKTAVTRYHGKELERVSEDKSFARLSIGAK
jgi:hypothetical protein